MSSSWRPHGLQPTRLLRPWDFPDKSTGVGCHFLLQCMEVKSESEVAQSCPTLGDPMDCSPPGSSVHGIFQARVLEWGAIAFSHSTIYGRSNLLKNKLYQVNIVFVNLETQSKVNEADSRVKYFPLFNADPKSWSLIIPFLHLDVFLPLPVHCFSIQRIP